MITRTSLPKNKPIDCENETTTAERMRAKPGT